MFTSNQINQFTQVHISEIQTGAILVNLGQLLEIEEYAQHYCLIIDRMNQKQVFKYVKDVYLIII